MSSIPSIYFYFPYYEDSGVPVLFYRMGNFIAEKYPEIQLYFIDYDNGSMARHLLKLPNIHLIPFKADQKTIVPCNAVLVMQSFLPYQWPYELQPSGDTFLFFWNLHPRNLFPSLLPFFALAKLPADYWWIYRFASILYPVFLPRLKRYGELLLSRNALFFMDEPNYESTIKYLYLKEINNIDFLPIPVTLNIIPDQRQKQSNPKRIRFCWVGRLCDWKSYPLVYTINTLGNIAKQFDIQIIYYIVGDGPFKNYIKQNIVKNKNIDVVFYGAIQHEKLDNFLDENVDVLTAMGTSVLEGAKLHIPTILIDGAYGPIKGDYVYRMLSTTRDYDLGHIITKSDMAPGNKSLQEIVVKIIQNYDSVAEESYQYYIKNHTIESVVDKFLSFVTQTKLTYNMIDKAYFKKSWAIWLHDALHPLYEKIIGRKHHNN